MTPNDDPLLQAIGRYRATIAAADDELAAWIDRADAILVDSVGLPVLTAASAVAVISLHVDEPLLAQHHVYGHEFSTLVKPRETTSPQWQGSRSREARNKALEMRTWAGVGLGRRPFFR